MKTLKMSYAASVLMFFLLFLCSIATEAQSFRRHEFSASLGFGPNMADKEVNSVLDQYFVHRDWNFKGECGDILGESFASINLEYYYRLNERWALGAIMGWGYASKSYYRIPIEEDAGMTSKYFYMAPSLKYAWFLKGIFRLYSRLATGAIRQHTTFDISRWQDGHDTTMTDTCSDEVKWKLAYQLTPVGFDFGIEPIRVYSELGYGCQGVFTIGVKVGL